MIKKFITWFRHKPDDFFLQDQVKIKNGFFAGCEGVVWDEDAGIFFTRYLVYFPNRDLKGWFSRSNMEKITQPEYTSKIVPFRKSVRREKSGF